MGFSPEIFAFSEQWLVVAKCILAWMLNFALTFLG